MKQIKKMQIISIIVISLLGMLAWTPAQAQQKNIILATTTSTQDSGLLDVLLPIFEKKTGYFVKTIAVGSGQAMAMGQKHFYLRGDFNRLRYSTRSNVHCAPSKFL